MKNIDDTLNLKFLFEPLFANTKFFASLVASLLILFTYISFQLDEYYKSETTLVFSDKYNLMSNQSSKDPISFFTESIASSTTGDIKALEILRSRDFFKILITNPEFVKNYFGVLSYEKTERTTNYDKSFILDNGEVNINRLPDFLESHLDFINSFLLVSKDKETGLINIGFVSKSPDSAYQLLVIVLNEFIQYVKSREINISTSSYEYLKSLLNEKNSQNLNNVLTQLISVDVKKMALYNSPDGLIEVIDSPYIPTLKFKPSKALFILITSFISFIFVYLLFIIRNAFR